MKKIIDFLKPFSIVKDIKNSPFKNLITKIYFGKIKYATPYYIPRNHNPYIIKIRKELPKFNRNNYFKLFNYHVMYGSPIVFTKNDLGWKDKFNSPRFEWVPAKFIFIGPFQLVIRYTYDNSCLDEYFEQYLWYKEYCNENIIETKKTWPWINFKTKLSSWNDDFLK